MPRTSTRADAPWAAPVLAASFALCLAGFYRGRPIPFGTDRMPPWPSLRLLTPAFFAHACRVAAPAALFWLAAWGAGLPLLRALRLPGAARLERVLLALGLGAGTLGLAALGLGAARLMRPEVLRVVLAAAGAWGAVSAARALRGEEARQELRALGAALKRPEAALPAAAAALALGYEALCALGPPVFYDSLVYHLALPALYLRRGALVATPANAYAGIPAGVEMLYAWLLPWGGRGCSCQLLHLTLAALTGAALVAAGRRLGRGLAGLWAAALFLTTPMVMLAAGRPGVELGWTFYLCLAMLALLAAGESCDRRWLLAAGVLCGLALGAKYQAVLLLPAAAALLPRGAGLGRALRAWALPAAVAVAVAAPWGLRNLAFYRNPVFPFAGNAFAPAAEVDVAAFEASAHALGPSALATRAGLERFLLHPWLYATPKEASEADNALSMAFLALLPLVLLAPAGGAARRLLLFGALLWLAMNALSGLARFGIPALAPLALGLALAAAEVRGAARLALAAGLSAVFASNLLYVHSKTDALLWRVLDGEIPAETFLAHQRPTYPAPPYAAFRWLDSHAPESSRVLLVGEPRSFYLDLDAETSSPYAAQPIAGYANAAGSGEDLARRLRQAGIGYVLLNEVEMTLSRQPMRMSAQGLASLRSFWSGQLEQVYEDRSEMDHDLRLSVVYRLLTPEQARRPHPPVPVPFAANAH